MEIKTSATAGTLESSDVYVVVEPGNGGIELHLESAVMNQYGKQIQETIQETLEKLGVSSAILTVNDKGALDCTIKARVECAVMRATGADTRAQKIDWGGMIS